MQLWFSLIYLRFVYKKLLCCRGTPSSFAEDFFLDVILQKHARRLLSARRLTDLGYFAAHLDFHLVAWLVKERDRAARIDDFVKALKQVHEDFNWPYPTPSVISNKVINSGKESFMFQKFFCLTVLFNSLNISEINLIKKTYF